MTGHAGRVSSLAWNSHMLSSGSKDTTIINHDVRIQQHITSRLTAHSQVFIITDVVITYICKRYHVIKIIHAYMYSQFLGGLRFSLVS